MKKEPIYKEGRYAVFAEHDGIALTLFPWDKGQVSQAKLIKFYKKHGFTPLNKSKNMIWEQK